jgi:hypothetical protein
MKLKLAARKQKLVFFLTDILFSPKFFSRINFFCLFFGGPSLSHYCVIRMCNKYLIRHPCVTQGDKFRGSVLCIGFDLSSRGGKISAFVLTTAIMVKLYPRS